MKGLVSIKRISVASLVFSVVACGTQEAQTPAVAGKSFAENQEENGHSSKWTDMVIDVQQKDAQGRPLNLSNNDSFEAKVHGCSSGFANQFDSRDLAVQVLAGDQGCRSSLVSFRFENEEFTFSATQDWKPGTSLDVKGDRGSELRFFVISNIKNPVTGPQAFKLVFEVIKKVKVKAETMVASVAPIGLDIVHNDVDVDPTSGAGIFNLNLDCLTEGDENVDGLCGSVDVKDLRIAVVRDSYGKNLTLDQCRQAALGGNSQKLSFDASQGFSATLTGPGPLFSDENSSLIFAISSSDPSIGCKFFRFSVNG